METYKIEHLKFTYPTMQQASLKDINLTICSGQFITLFGQSGSGKTTLLRHLKPQLTPAGKRDGKIYFMNTIIEDVDLHHQSSEIGYVMQDPDHQIVTDKVWHELAFGLESLGYDNATIRLRVAEISNFFNISDWFHKKTSELSGGQKQLLNLASIMTMQPKVLILDEPTSQLDPITAVEFLETLKKINRELAVTIILSEHRLEEVFSYSDRVILIDKAKIIYDDTPQKIGQFMHSTKHPLKVAMPTPIQLFTAFQQTAKCPTTIKEGRLWLEEYLIEQGVNIDKIIDTNQNKISLNDNINLNVFDKLKETIFNKKQDISYAIKLKEVWFRYSKNDSDILKDLNLNIKKGQLHAIIGGNGAGKSTLLSVIAGINPFYRGKVILFDKPINDYSSHQLFGKTVALLPQNPQTLFVEKTLKRDLQTVLKRNKESIKNNEILINKALTLTELTDKVECHPYDLSGGEQQRAALAKILLLDPDIILLDEPTKGLDGFYKIKLANILKQLMTDGKTVVMVSHDIEFCAKYADYCSLLFDGQLISSGQAVSFFSGNAFYTTAANRLSRHLFNNCIKTTDIIENIKILCDNAKENSK